MSYYFPEMEWNAKWNWENVVAFSSKVNESPEKQQLADCMIVAGGEINAGSYNLSGAGGSCGGGSGSSGSYGGGAYGATDKSSISASRDSTTKECMQAPYLNFMKSEGSSGYLSKNIEMKETKISGPTLPLEASVGSVEPLIGLKLGKRTYFENSGVGGNSKTTSFSATRIPSSCTPKKSKPSAQTVTCQVEGCNFDLSTSKQYYRKHRVCGVHSKCSKVLVGGLDRRFCQQCSRFHGLLEFDENKRSCRRRLSDHNARRRKPRQETVSINSARLPSLCHGGRQQVGFLLNKSPLIHPETSVNSTWDGACNNSKFTVTKDYHLKSYGDGMVDTQLNMQQIKLPHASNMHIDAANGFAVAKTLASGILNPGYKGTTLISYAADAAPEYHPALSLLSSDSWGSCDPESIPVAQLQVHAVPHSSSELCLSGLQSVHPYAQSMTRDHHFQDFCGSKPTNELDFY